MCVEKTARSSSKADFAINSKDRLASMAQYPFSIWPKSKQWNKAASIHSSLPKIAALASLHLCIHLSLPFSSSITPIIYSQISV